VRKKISASASLCSLVFVTYCVLCQRRVIDRFAIRGAPPELVSCTYHAAHDPTTTDGHLKILEPCGIPIDTPAWQIQDLFVGVEASQHRVVAVRGLVIEEVGQDVYGVFS
jgi:hypothetical protein